MYLNFKRWTKGEDEIHTATLRHVDEKFQHFIKDLSEYGVEKESIFIFGMLYLLDQLHQNEHRYFDRLRILLETYIIFLRERSYYKDHNLRPLEISTILDRSEIYLHGFFDPNSDGSPECYNLVESLSNFIENMVKSDRENLLMFTLRGTKH